MSDRVEALRHCRLLSGFSDVGLQILAAVAKERVYPRSQALQVQGELPRDPGALVFLVSGQVRCEVRDSEDRILGLGTLKAGDHLGGLRLFGDTPAPLSAIAETDVSALLLERAAFERLRRQKPQAAMKLLLAITTEFGQLVGESSSMFADFAVFAAARANITERTYTTYSGFSLEQTNPGLKTD